MFFSGRRPLAGRRRAGSSASLAPGSVLRGADKWGWMYVVVLRAPCSALAAVRTLEKFRQVAEPARLALVTQSAATLHIATRCYALALRHIVLQARATDLRRRNSFLFRRHCITAALARHRCAPAPQHQHGRHAPPARRRAGNRPSRRAEPAVEPERHDVAVLVDGKFDKFDTEDEE